MADSSELKSLLASFGRVTSKNDSKLIALVKTINEKYKNRKILIFTEYADTAEYVAQALTDHGMKKVSPVTGNSGNPTELARRFSPKSNHKKSGEEVTSANEINILVATDVLSEGQNLQDAAIVVNYDLPWAIIRLIQRAGRVDRVGQTSDTVEILSFFHESIEEVLNLRDRIRHRLSQNAKAFGSDEKFFGTQEETAIIEGLYNGDLPDDGAESDNDASSLAFEIWSNAKETDPERTARVERLADLVFATRPARELEGDSVATFVRTERGMDGFGHVSNDSYKLMTAYEALKYFECEPSTPGLQMLESHFRDVQGLVHGPLKQTAVVAGQLTGVRKRLYQRLKSSINELPQEMAEILELISSRPLTSEAESRLGKALSARSTEDLATLISALNADSRLVLPDLPGSDPIRIVCSMGARNV